MDRIGGYALEGELGRGAMGAVFRARDPVSGQRVALKLLTGTSGTAQRRFQIEARSLQRLDHPHLVRVLDAGEANGRPFLVMELVDGASLQAQLARSGALPAREAVTVCRDVAHALQHAHERGVIHRDVKPANVFMDRAGRGRLGDFGLARELDGHATRVTVEGALLGTPGYLPPEQVRGELGQIGVASDVYALGATLFALLTGGPPFSAEHLGVLLDATLRQRAQPPSSQGARVDARLDAIVLRCLEKEPERRFPSAAALAADLDAWLRGDPAPRPPGTHAGALRLAFLCALLVGVAGWGLRTRQAAREEGAAQAALDEAEGWIAARAWSRAAEAATRALALLPDSPRALAARAFASQFGGDLEQAIADAERLIVVAPSDPQALGAAVPILRDLERQKELTARGLALDPRQPELLRLRAFFRRTEQDFEGAQADLRLALEVAPGDPEGWAALSRSFRTSDPAAALEAARRACRLAPGRGDLLEELGILLEVAGDRPGALDAYWRSSYLGFWRGAWRLSEAALAGYEPERVEAALGGWLARAEHPILRTYRARLRLGRGDLEGAEADLTAALETSPQPAEVAMWRGLTRFRRRDFAAAEADFDLAWRLGSDPAQLTNRGVARLEQGRLVEAEADLRLSAELDPKRANSQYQLGVALQRLERHPEALERFLRAVELDPTRISAYQAGARELQVLGRAAEGRQLLERAAAQLPADDPRREALARQAAELADQGGEPDERR